MNKVKTEITIIGAGLTGLTMAWYLKRAGKKVVLLEKSNKTGGVIDTVNENGFVFEKGPNTGVVATPEVVELFDDLAGKVEMELPNVIGKKRWIWKNGKWQILPQGFRGITTPLFTVKDKIRIFGEPFRKVGTNPDETLSEMVVRRLGQSFLEYAVDPFISGIYAGDPDRLVTRFALPKLYNLEQTYGSFIKGAHKKHKEPKSYLEKRVSREVFSVKGGFSNLINVLSQEVGNENMIFNISNLQVNKRDDDFVSTFIFDGREVEVLSQKVISTCSGMEVKKIFPLVRSDLMDKASNAVYAKVIQVTVGYRLWDGINIDAFGGLIPSVEKREMLGVLFLSSLFQSRAPDNGALLSVFLGGIKRPDIFDKPDDEIERLVRIEIEETLGSRKNPDLFKIFRYEHAIPQYEKSTGERLAAVEQIQNLYPGLIIAGNLRDGIGMADRIKQGKQIATQIIQVL